jgi:3-deoxy-D-manno-octulosonic acid kinase
MATIRRDLGAGHHFIFDDTLIRDPNEDTFTPHFWHLENKVTGKAKGRGTTIFIEHDHQHWVLRHYMRGGLVGKVLSDQYLFGGVERSRPFEEFRLLEHMRKQGLRVPVPVAARIHRIGLIYRGDLITQTIPNSVDLHKALCENPLSTQDWQNVGKALAAMHNCQVYHHDANVRNIMMDDERHIWLIDFDRCKIQTGNAWKKQNLDRLLRSLHKEKNKNPVFHWQVEQWQSCIDGYNAVSNTTV